MKQTGKGVIYTEVKLNLFLILLFRNSLMLRSALEHKKRLVDGKKETGTKESRWYDSNPLTVVPKMWRIPSKLLYSGAGRGKTEYEKIGLCCPSSICDYVIKDFVELEDIEEEQEE